MKDMNTMKHLAKRIVNFYINKALMNENETTSNFIQICSQAEGVRAHKNLNAHGKFILRFCKWCSDVGDRPLVEMMSLMDDFFEKENYTWEDLIEYV
jgi:hypothetical protein